MREARDIILSKATASRVATVRTHAVLTGLRRRTAVHGVETDRGQRCVALVCGGMRREAPAVGDAHAIDEPCRGRSRLVGMDSPREPLSPLPRAVEKARGRRTTALARPKPLRPAASTDSGQRAGGRNGRVSVTALGNWDGADAQNRTADLLITNQLLYQLSYVGVFRTGAHDNRKSASGQPTPLLRWQAWARCERGSRHRPPRSWCRAAAPAVSPGWAADRHRR